MILSIGVFVIVIVIILYIFIVKSLTAKKSKIDGKLRMPRLQATDRDQVYVDVSTQPNAGLGLFAARSFARDETVCIYSGNIIGGRAAAALKERTYLMRLAKGVSVDAGPCPDIAARYINDNCDRAQLNTRFKKEPKRWRALVVATKDIMAGEEFFASYGRRSTPCSKNSHNHVHIHLMLIHLLAYMWTRERHWPITCLTTSHMTKIYMMIRTSRCDACNESDDHWLPPNSITRHLTQSLDT